MHTSIGMLLLIIAGGLLGVITSLYVVVSLIGTIIYKVYRCHKYHISMYD